MLLKYARMVTDIIFPKYCLGCMNLMPANARNRQICQTCEDNIRINHGPFCQKCGIGLIESEMKFCKRCQKLSQQKDLNLNNQETNILRLYFDRAWSAYAYQGPLKNLIHLFKYKGYDKLGLYFSALLANFIHTYNLPIKVIDYLIPVPLHKRKLREREFNQAEVLANELSKKFNIPLMKNNLIRIKDTKSQTELSIEQRLTNVSDAFLIKCPQKIKNKNILLIDDVMTTGATISEGSLALKNAGAALVFSLALSGS